MRQSRMRPAFGTSSAMRWYGLRSDDTPTRDGMIPSVRT